MGNHVNLRDVKVAIRMPNPSWSGVPACENREKRRNKKFKIILAENSPKFMKDGNHDIQELQCIKREREIEQGEGEGSGEGG